MRRMTYAEAAAAAAGGNTELQQQQQQTSTGTSPSVYSAVSSPEDWSGRKPAASNRSSPQEATPTAANPASDADSAEEATSSRGLKIAEQVGANPGTVKLLREQFERQSSDGSFTGLLRQRLPSVVAAVSCSSRPSVPAPETSASAEGGYSGSEDGRQADALTDAQACAEFIQQLLHEKQQLQQQVDSLWNQKEAFRCANERMAKTLLRQQHQRAAAVAAAAEAAGATPRKDVSRRCVTVVPPGCFTSRGPIGPRWSVPIPGRIAEVPPVDFTAMKIQPRQSKLQHPRCTGRQSPQEQVTQQLQQPQLQQQQQRQQKMKANAIPGMAPLNLGALQQETAPAPRNASSRASGVSLCVATSGDRGTSRMGGSLTCRVSLASSALKTPRRKFGDGVISARGSARGWQRRGVHEEEEQHQQHKAIEEALVASLRSLNMLGSFSLGSGNSRMSARAASGPEWEPTPEAALTRCSSNPDRGYWHSTFLCVLKVEGTDFFLDVVRQNQQQQQDTLPSFHSTASSFFSSTSAAGDVTESQAMNGARVMASKETAGVFQVCVRHLLKDDNWLRSICVSMFWGLTSAVDEAELPPDQTLQHGLSVEGTQAGSLQDSKSSAASDDASEQGQATPSADTDNNSGAWSGWDLVAFMYQRSIDATGNPVTGKAVSSSTNLYISSRVPEGAMPGSSPSFSTGNSTTQSSNNKANVDMRRAEPYSTMNQLLLQKGPQKQNMFLVRAKDRHAGVMPLYHRSTQKYVHVHPTMGLVGLVPPVIEQEKQLRHLQKVEQQRKKSIRRRLKAKKHHDTTQHQQDGVSSNTSSSVPDSPQAEVEPITADMFLRPCRIEMIPLADLLLQQSVHRLLSSVQELAMQTQQEQPVAEAARGPIAEAASLSSLSGSSSDEGDSFDGVVASEGGEDIDPNKVAGSRRPLVPPLGLPPVGPAETLSPSTPQQPPVLAFHLDDEGVDTDVEGDSLAHCTDNGCGPRKAARAI
ncbi:hypothetical protein, conserved [Eimeria tenella]|uniref:Uncharacterized protein n=1 Tax=Eimeria tenella TaxID=5802 RepID=U6KQW3_EIMTE|nr:hypothetical protein, conserved [Eimeria tenella]CDJ40477.1 hypothetical protein, conserved [Eimeria tenella]|eukprot:XP_013231227.1 hypothetical protein, conserved [Eimeria tenella]